MVLDQLNHKVEDLVVVLTGNVLDARFDDDLARRLDGYTHYQVSLDLETPERLQQLHESLHKIFEGKSGLTIRGTEVRPTTGG
jgi:hypothetical protein